MTEDEADALLASNGRDVAALIAKADHRYCASDRRSAAAFYGAALQAARQGEAAERTQLAHAAGRAQEIQNGTLPHLVSELAAAGHSQADWHPRFAEAVAIMAGQRQRTGTSAQFPQMPTAYFHPGLPEHAFFDPADFAWREQVEAATGTIRSEGLGLLQADGTFEPYVRKVAHRPQGDVHGMLENRDWTTYDLTEKGQPVAERTARCPQTFAIVSEAAPLCDIPNRAPSVMFSLLAASKRIPPHMGMINARLVCHLPLVIPGEGALRVGEEKRQWHEGELLVFDDSVEHEAWNAADKDRLVLIFDIWHPLLEQVEREQIAALFAAVDSY